MDACYIARHNAIAAPVLELFLERVAQFHELRDIFIITGVHETISLPCVAIPSHGGFYVVEGGTYIRIGLFLCVVSRGLPCGLGCHVRLVFGVVCRPSRIAVACLYPIALCSWGCTSMSHYLVIVCVRVCHVSSTYMVLCIP